MRRLLVLLSIVLPMLACSLSSSPTPPTPTTAPAAVLGSPVVGINPVIGAPGSRITVTVAGFPAGASVNLFLSLANAPSTTPLQTLPVNQSGTLSFGLEIPAQLGNTPLTNNTVLIFTMAAINGGPSANALFLVTGSSGLATGIAPTATTSSGSGGSTGGTGGGFYIITPGSGVAIPGNAVVVTGSTTSTSPITVQVLDANNNVLGSASAAINTTAGTPYVWQATVSFAPPAAATNGYVAAFNGLQQSTSVLIVLNGSSGVQQPSPQFAPTITPGGLFPIVTTATPLFGQ